MDILKTKSKIKLFHINETIVSCKHSQTEMNNALMIASLPLITNYSLMKTLILYSILSFFIVNGVSAQQYIKGMKPGKYKIDGLELTIERTFPERPDSPYLTVTDLEEHIDRKKIIQMRSSPNAMKVVVDESGNHKIIDIVWEVTNSTRDSKRGRGIRYILFPDKDDITRISKIHAVSSKYDITLEELKKIFDRIKNEVDLAPRKGVSVSEVSPAIYSFY